MGGKIENKDAVRAALRKANFQSVRGSFKFNNNHMPIQNFYVFEVVKDGNKDRYTHKTIAVAMADAQDAYHDECKMK